MRIAPLTQDEGKEGCIAGAVALESRANRGDS